MFTFPSKCPDDILYYLQCSYKKIVDTQSMIPFSCAHTMTNNFHQKRITSRKWTKEKKNQFSVTEDEIDECYDDVWGWFFFLLQIFCVQVSASGAYYLPSVFLNKLNVTIFIYTGCSASEIFVFSESIKTRLPCLIKLKRHYVCWKEKNKYFVYRSFFPANFMSHCLKSYIWAACIQKGSCWRL